MENQFENYDDFFYKCGDAFVHPKNYGECIWPVSVEELFYHFKTRLIEELETEHGDLIRPR